MMNEKSFPLLAGLVALLLVLLLAFSILARPASQGSSPESIGQQDVTPVVSGSNSVRQSVQLPFPVPATVQIKQ